MNRAGQRERVEEKARAVLAAQEKYLAPVGDDARSLKSKSKASWDSEKDLSLATSTLTKTATLADLYDPPVVPPELFKAHTELDRAVEKCYRPEPFHSDRERVEFLFSLDEKLTAPLLPVTFHAKGRRSRIAAPTPRPGRQRTPALRGQSPPNTQAEDQP